MHNRSRSETVTRGACCSISEYRLHFRALNCRSLNYLEFPYQTSMKVKASVALQPKTTFNPLLDVERHHHRRHKRAVTQSALVRSLGPISQLSARVFQDLPAMGRRGEENGMAPHI
jgi:hypothetical protein